MKWLDRIRNRPQVVSFWQALKFTFLIADSMVIDFVQWRIADPLQFRGISLLTQVRALSVLFGALQIHPFSGNWWSLALQILVFAFWLGRAIWPPDYLVRRMTPTADPFINMYRFWPVTIAFRLVMLFLAITSLPMIVIFWQGPMMMASLALMEYLEACSPKPPRPKRKKVRLLVPVEV